MIRGVRNFLITLAIVALLALAAVCVRIMFKPEDGAAGPAEPIVIEYWTHVDAQRSKLEERLIEEFMRDNPGITVHRSEYTAVEMLNVVNTAFDASQAPDFFNFPAEGIAELLYSGRLEPVDYQASGFGNKEGLLDTYLDGVFSAVTMDDKIYGIPLELTNWCLYINRNLFEQAGLDPDNDYPKTWEEMVAVCQKLVKRDGAVLERRGFDFRYPYYLVFFVPMVEQLGGSVISPDGKSYIYNDEAWEKALSFMASWGPLDLNLGSPTYINARTIFNQEKIAMCLSGLYQESRMETDNPSFYNSEEWMVVPFPTFSSSVEKLGTAPYPHFFLVNSSSSDRVKTACWKLIGYFASHGEDYLREINLIVPRKDLIDSPLFSNIPYSSVFLEQMSYSHPVYSGRHAAQIQNLIGEAVESVMLSGESPEKAVISLRASVQELFYEN